MPDLRSDLTGQNFLDFGVDPNDPSTWASWTTSGGDPNQAAWAPGTYSGTNSPSLEAAYKASNLMLAPPAQAMPSLADAWRMSQLYGLPRDPTSATGSAGNTYGPVDPSSHTGSAGNTYGFAPPSGGDAGGVQQAGIAQSFQNADLQQQALYPLAPPESSNQPTASGVGLQGGTITGGGVSGGGGTGDATGNLTGTAGNNNLTMPVFGSQPQPPSATFQYQDPLFVQQHQAQAQGDIAQQYGGLQHQLQGNMGNGGFSPTGPGYAQTSALLGAHQIGDTTNANQNVRNQAQTFNSTGALPYAAQNQSAWQSNQNRGLQYHLGQQGNQLGLVSSIFGALG